MSRKSKFSYEAKLKAVKQFKTKIDLLDDPQHKYLIYAPYAVSYTHLTLPTM